MNGREAQTPDLRCGGAGRAFPGHSWAGPPLERGALIPEKQNQRGGIVRLSVRQYTWGRRYAKTDGCTETQQLPVCAH